MKVSELMIGDIVTFKDCQNDKEHVIIKIWSINQDGEAFAFIDDYESLDEIVIDDEIVGLPITPEILEKNGWEYNNYNNETENEEEYYVDRDGFEIHINGEKFEIRCIDAVNIQLKYLHELQHALKLCGIDKTIEL